MGRVYLPAADATSVGCEPDLSGPPGGLGGPGGARGPAGGRVVRDGASAPSPARPPEPRLRGHDGGDLPAGAAPDRGGPGLRHSGPGLAAGHGEALGGRPQPGGGRAVSGAIPTSANGSVVVVGGGLAGITAALDAAEAGAAVTLVERRSRLGGLTWSFERDGRWFDNGQHVFLRCCTAYLELLGRLGVGGDVALQPRLDVPVLSPGRPLSRLRRNRLPAPLHLSGALARYRPVPMRERARIPLAGARSANPRSVRSRARSTRRSAPGCAATDRASTHGRRCGT